MRKSNAAFKECCNGRGNHVRAIFTDVLEVRLRANDDNYAEVENHSFGHVILHFCTFSHPIIIKSFSVGKQFWVNSY